MHDKRKIKNYYINHKSQTNLAIYIILLILGSGGSVLFYFRYLILSNLGLYRGAMSDNVMDEILMNIDRFSVVALSLLLVNLIISILFVIYYSHRIFGPIYAMEKFLKEKTGGREPERQNPLNLRNKDEFKTLANLISQALSGGNVSAGVGPTKDSQD